MEEKVIEVKNLTTQFKTDKGLMKAVDGVSFHVCKGEILGIVGESGCGKSVTSQSILRLFDEKYTAKYQGEVLFEGKDILKISQKEMQAYRGHKISMVFQDALSSLNPVFTVGQQIVETLMIHQNMTKETARDRAIEMIRLVGINSPEERFDQYPHELSGGMRQRIMIAIALCCEPKILIADEPTTALDVTIQAQIMDLIVDLNKKLNMGVILITHDLAVVAETCSRVCVMYLGQIVEEADVNQLFDCPMHPYTRGLIKSIPQLEGARQERLYMIKGMVPLLSQIPQGCRFAPRCEYATERCLVDNPELVTMENGQKVRCHRAKELYGENGNITY